jgi:hypothetical protein
MNKQFLIYAGVGLAVVAIGLVFVFSSTKGNHLELKGKIIKTRTGALDENNSIAVMDFRIENISDIPFVVREVTPTLEKAKGETSEGSVVSKRDIDRVFAYNRFLGSQYNDALTIKDTVPPHGTIDRMVAATFRVPEAELENSKAIHLTIQDMDGAVFETTYAIKK